MFKNVIVRRPSKSLIHGITSSPELGKPDYELALKQHDEYIDAMKSCSVEVTVLEAEEEYPDSCFVEDPAVITDKCVIITKPGAESRTGETEKIMPIIRKYYREDQIEYITGSGTLEGGDVMMIGDHFFIGHSDRTNEEGIRQFTKIVEKYGKTVTAVPVKTVLHLKTGTTYMGDNNLLVIDEFADNEAFKDFNRIVVPEEESYAVNCINMNGKVIVPDGFPKVKKILEDLGYPTIPVPMTEYRKIDGGLTCLSLRF